MLICLQVTKTLQFRKKPIDIILPSLANHPLCPCTALRALILMPGDPLGPLFMLSDKRVLTYAIFLKSLRFVLKSLGLDPCAYGGHSFRRGAATWASLAGLTESEIKMLGYWSSDCFLRYVHSDRDQRINALQSFSAVLPSY